MDPTYSLRPATPDDIESIAAQRSAMFYDMGVDETSVKTQNKPFCDWLSWQFKAGSYREWFVMHEDTIVGGAGLWLHEWIPNPSAPDGIRGYICNVYIDPAHRHQGLAHALIQQCIDACRERGLTVIALHASEAGRPIYASMGFGTTSEMRLQLYPET